MSDDTEHSAAHDRSCVCWQRRPGCGCYLWDQDCPHSTPPPVIEDARAAATQLRHAAVEPWEIEALDYIDTLIAEHESLTRAMQATDDFRIADWLKLEAERDAAEAEVERLTAERDGWRDTYESHKEAMRPYYERLTADPGYTADDAAMERLTTPPTDDDTAARVRAVAATLRPTPSDRDGTARAAAIIADEREALRDLIEEERRGWNRRGSGYSIEVADRILASDVWRNRPLDVNTKTVNILRERYEQLLDVERRQGPILSADERVCRDCGRTDGGCDRVVQGDAKLPGNSDDEREAQGIYHPALIEGQLRFGGDTARAGAFAVGAEWALRRQGPTDQGMQ